MIELNDIFFSIIGYFLGSIPTGLIFGKLVLKKDISKTGNKTIGASNIFYLSSNPATNQAVAVQKENKQEKTS